MESKLIFEFQKIVKKELFGNIIPFWLEHSVDWQDGGFWGQITNDLKVNKNAPRSLILTSRILWTFSAFYRFQPEGSFLRMAEHAYEYLTEKFFDPVYGGTFWMVDRYGRVLDDSKKMYGQAFTIYALAEYFLATAKKEALTRAMDIFDLVEKYNFDQQYKGYFENSRRDWSKTEDMRLSENDMNAYKSMNTHLHLMEAYSTLYQAGQNPKVRSQLERLIDNFLTHIIDPVSHHFRLFFDDRWNSLSKGISFGHEIEGSWLLWEAVQYLKAPARVQQVRQTAVQIARLVLEEGIGKNCFLRPEKNPENNGDMKIVWWEQAEAVVGFLNAYHLTQDKQFMDAAIKIWDFIGKNLVDHEHGEWFYEVTADGIPDPKRFKVSEWKCPYHNGRACLEVLKRLEILKNKNVAMITEE